METLAEPTGKNSEQKLSEARTIKSEVQSVFFLTDFTFGQLLSKITRLSLITLDTFDVTSLRQQQWNLV